MKNFFNKYNLISPFLIIIFAAIFIQLAGRYHATHVLVYKRYFLTLWVVLRIFIPFFIIYLLKIPLSQTGFRLPEIDRKKIVLICILLIVFALIFTGIYFYHDYLNAYSGSFQTSRAGKSSRFWNFMIFTSSTLIGWEILHRGFLLSGLKYILTEREKISERLAIQISISVVWIFEVVYHFIKPEMEALGLLIGSPILSYLAIKSKSILPSFLIHFAVELMFIFALTMR